MPNPHEVRFTEVRTHAKLWFDAAESRKSAHVANPGLSENHLTEQF